MSASDTASQPSEGFRPATESSIPVELRNIAEQVKRGEQPEVSVWVLLSWFGSKRRGRSIVALIRQALESLHLKTEPDFDWTYLRDWIRFVATNDSQTSAESTDVSEGVTERPDQSVSTVDQLQMSDAAAAAVSSLILAPSLEPTYRVGRLDIANRPPACVSPDADIHEAVTMMLRDDFSQLPVVRGDRDVKGLISWRSLGSRLSFGTPCRQVRDAIEPHCEITTDQSLFKAIALIKQHDCVLVRDTTRKLCGILTAYDISMTFGDLAEPFLILSEIESHIRAFISGKFTAQELESVRDPGDTARVIKTVADLTLGECVRLLENPARWNKLLLPIDRVAFVKGLDEIRQIRNDVMHFDPEGLDEDELRKLRNFDGFLERVRKLMPLPQKH